MANFKLTATEGYGTAKLVQEVVKLDEIVMNDIVRAAAWLVKSRAATPASPLYR